jgi:hypothetical protein
MSQVECNYILAHEGLAQIPGDEVAVTEIIHRFHRLRRLRTTFIELLAS